MEGRAIQSERDPLLKESIARIVKAKQQRGTLTDERREHTCDPSFCQPECERMICTAPYIASNVYVCRYGSVHLCSTDTCTLYASADHNTCPVSGFQMGLELSSYSKHDFRTWRNPTAAKQSIGVSTVPWLLGVGEKEKAFVPPEPVKKRKRAYSRQMSEEDAKQAASDVVKLLLYSHQRRRCIANVKERYKRQGEQAKQTYMKTQREQGQLPYVSDVYRLMAHYQSQAVQLKEFEFNKTTHDYYTFIITQVWDIVQRYHVPLQRKRYENDVEMVPRLDFNAIAVGALYLMRNGVHKRHAELLPADAFLMRNLPTINMLVHFGIEKSAVTKGDALITQAYDNALEGGASVHELMLEMEKLPRPETVKYVQQGSIKVKLSSSGEKLFMPQSRKNATMKK